MTTKNDPKGNSLDKAKLLAVHSLAGPFNQKIKVQYYADESIRFRVLDAGPMSLTAAFLNGQEKDVVLQISSLKDEKSKNETLKQIVMENAPERALRGIFPSDLEVFLFAKNDKESERGDAKTAGSIEFCTQNHDIGQTLVFKPDLAGEPHARISVPCPGKWEYFDDFEEDETVGQDLLSRSKLNHPATQRQTKNETPEDNIENTTQCLASDCKCPKTHAEIKTTNALRGAHEGQKVNIVNKDSSGVLTKQVVTIEKIIRTYTEIDYINLSDDSYIMSPDIIIEGSRSKFIHRYTGQGICADDICLEIRRPNQSSYQEWASLFEEYPTG